MKRWEKDHKAKLITKLVKAGAFYPAEDFHQGYIEKHGRFYC